MNLKIRYVHEEYIDLYKWPNAVVVVKLSRINVYLSPAASTNHCEHRKKLILLYYSRLYISPVSSLGYDYTHRCLKL